MRLPPLFPEDIAKNYKVTVHANKDKIEEIIIFLFFMDWLSEPQVVDLPIRYILQAMQYHSTDIIIQAILNEELWLETGMNVIDSVRGNISSDFSTVAKAVSEYYSLPAIWEGYISEFADSDQRKKRIKDIGENIETYVDKVLAEIQAENISGIKWRDKINLYLLVHSLYRDAQFLYQPKWLDGQTIDVFIPKPKVGIEHQGIQHYEPTGVINGERGFIETIKKDEWKRILCENNGVKLLEWPYTLDITAENLNDLLKIHRRKK